MPTFDTGKPDARVHGARAVIATAALLASLTTAVAVPSSLASEPVAETGPSHGVVRAQLRRLLGARTSRWSRLTAKSPMGASSRNRSAAPSSSSTGRYSIPASIVMCESGGDYRAVNQSTGAGGAYQILPSTWVSHGGTDLPQDAPPAEQDAIAAKIYATDGRGAWSC
jgi:hypothetical protein